MQRQLDTSPPKPAPPSSAPKPKRPLWRGVQVSALLVSSLSLVGYGLINLDGGAQSRMRLLTPLGEAPSFSVLLAGLDVEYCAWATPTAPARHCAPGEKSTLKLQGDNTDTLILVNFEQTDVTMLSIPRDTLTPGTEHKINASYNLGGPEKLRTDMETLLGKRIDYYAIVRTDYVASVIDALGGLDVSIPQGSEVKWVDRAAGINFHLGPGQHHLDGADAVTYLRVRKGFGDDYGRMDRQKSSIAQLLNRLRSAQGLRALPTLIGEFSSGVETNANVALLEAMQPFLSQYRLNSYTLPTTDIPGSTALALNRRAYAQLENPPLKGGNAPDAPLEPARLRIVNASGVSGLGRKLGQYLALRGFPEATVESSEKSSEASQVITRDRAGAAGRYAQFLGLPQLQALRFPVVNGEVLIYLGADAGERYAALSAFSSE